MRVKLSYTTEADDLLSESSFLLNRLSEVFRGSLENFNDLVEELKEEKVNVSNTLESVDNLRLNLGKIDLRLMEIGDILIGFEHHRLAEHLPDTPRPPVPQTELRATPEGEEDG